MRTAFEGQRARAPKLSAIDLNLLVAFEALYRERSVTKAGRHLGLSQPATSAALAKLRALLGDPLFVKTPRGLEPTERCDALAKPVAQALSDLRDALGDESFDPASAERAFKVGSVDAVLAVVMPELASRVAGEAPHVQIGLRSIDPGAAIALLDAREIDLAIAPCPDVPKHLSFEELFPVPLAVGMRVDHPLRGAPTLADLGRFPHAVVVFAGPPRTPIDDALEALGVVRRATIVASSFLAVPDLIARCDAIALLPRPSRRRSPRAAGCAARRCRKRFTRRRSRCG
jgi:DNA-binding transcriptional LysR family regulator